MDSGGLQTTRAGPRAARPSRARPGVVASGLGPARGPRGLARSLAAWGRGRGRARLPRPSDAARPPGPDRSPGPPACPRAPPHRARAPAGSRELLGGREAEAAAQAGRGGAPGSELPPGEAPPPGAGAFRAHPSAAGSAMLSPGGGVASRVRVAHACTPGAPAYCSTYGSVRRSPLARSLAARNLGGSSVAGSSSGFFVFVFFFLLNPKAPNSEQAAPSMHTAVFSTTCLCMQRAPFASGETACSFSRIFYVCCKTKRKITKWKAWS